MKITLLLVFCLTIGSVSAWNYNNPYLTQVLNEQKMDWITQSVDHFNYHSNQTFLQRYYALDDYYTPGGPAYLYICGEAECKGISNSSWTASIAKQTQGIIFAL